MAVCVCVCVQTHFESLGLLPELIRAVEEMGWSLPSAVQDEAVRLASTTAQHIANKILEAKKLPRT